MWAADWGYHVAGTITRGVIAARRRTSGQSGAHGLVAGRVFSALYQHVQAQRLGAVFTGATGFQLRRDPDTVRAPDAAFVRTERLPPEGLGDGFVQLAPDLAVEVVSPSDRGSELEEKVEEYLSVGVRGIWIVDPATRTVTVDAAGHPVHILREADALEGGDIVPGFRCPVADLFAGVRRR
jgi:Uma2 family endonuclease